MKLFDLVFYRLYKFNIKIGNEELYPETHTILILDVSIFVNFLSALSIFEHAIDFKIASTEILLALFFLFISFTLYHFSYKKNTYIY
jgi:hypothetical protein